jgi:hypothetical protein
VLTGHGPSLRDRSLRLAVAVAELRHVHGAFDVRPEEMTNVIERDLRSAAGGVAVDCQAWTVVATRRTHRCSRTLGEPSGRSPKTAPTSWATRTRHVGAQRHSLASGWVLGVS